MSIRKGNDKIRSGDVIGAIREYEKISESNPLYKFAKLIAGWAERQLQAMRRAPKTPGLRSERESTLPKVSIIMPVFDAGKDLDESILSVRDQTYKDFELIIVDDASTDDSRKIIRAHADLDNRIRAIYLDYHTSGGGGIPRNIGIDVAIGSYIGFINGGDCFTETAIEKLVAAAERHQADVVMGGGRTFMDEACDLQAFEKLPTNEVFLASSCPGVFHTSAVSCRKLYRRGFLEDNGIAFPEGDYFYEDNPLHWFVLASHSRIVKIDEITSSHRMLCVEHMTGEADYKLAAICCHLNTIACFLVKCANFQKNQPAINAFYEYCCRSRWIWQRQERSDVKAILGRRVAQIIERNWKKMSATKVPSNFENLIKEFSEGYPQYDLTVVIPAYNCEAFIEKTALSVLSVPGIRTNVLVMDDGSSDRTAEVCKKLEETHVNFHFFRQENKGAGSARNALIPLCTGTYTLFLDADDVVNGILLAKAVVDARAKGHDLYFMKYQIEYYERHKINGMFGQDHAVWNSFRGAKNNNELRRLALSLVNYPWNRIIKTELLHDANIFFGTGSFSEDVLFNWESLLVADNIGYGDEVVITYRKFEQRSQLTNVVDYRRLTAFDMLEFAHYRIVKHQNSKYLMDVWCESMEKRMKWIKGLIPENFQPQFEVRKAKLMNLLARSFEKKMHDI